jgi:carbonic anhydrase
MKKLLKGVEKFQTEIFQKKKVLFESLAEEGQHPRVLFITCSDSRIDPFLLTQSDPGDLFVIRNAGNIIPPYTGSTCGEAASIEYAISILEVKHIVICGHSHCGAIGHLIDHHDHLFDEHIPMVSKWLRYADATRTITEAHWHEYSEAERKRFAIETNIVQQLKHLETHPSVARALSSGLIETHGWLYCMETGEVRYYDRMRKQFERVDTPVSI